MSPRVVAIAGGLVLIVLVGGFFARPTGGGENEAAKLERAISADTANRECPSDAAPPVVDDASAPYSLTEVGTAEQPVMVVVHPTEDVAATALLEGVIQLQRGDDEPVEAIDLSDDTKAQHDGGLLNLAWAPDGTWLYADRTDADGTTIISAYPYADVALDEDGEVVILEVPQDNAQHNGGGFVFGPDRYLYIALGDGGGLGDPRARGQDPNQLLGKLLRIDATPTGDEPYEIPADNPHVGDDEFRPEIFAMGLRNPFRMSFDPVTGDLWIGDVGQSCWEEINRITIGDVSAADPVNFGWDRWEGTRPFQDGPPVPDVTFPVAEISHKGGWCSITAGFLYRGDALADLDEAFLFTDLCKGRVVALTFAADGTPEFTFVSDKVERPVAIVPDADGEPLIVSIAGGIHRLEPAA